MTSDARDALALRILKETNRRLAADADLGEEHRKMSETVLAAIGQAENAADRILERGHSG